jgi:O-antigen/teichoic acid export membrane protein
MATGVATTLWKIVDWRPRFAFSRRHFVDLFGFGSNVLATDIMYIIGGQADRLLLGYFLGAADVGYYSVAQRLINITADFVGGSTEGTVLPLFSRIQNDKARVVIFAALGIMIFALAIADLLGYRLDRSTMTIVWPSNTP